MTTIYNVKSAEYDLEFIEDDTIDLAFSAKKNNIIYNMTGMQICMKVRQTDVFHTLIKSFSSTGATPEITINSEIMYIYSVTGFTTPGAYEYDIQIMDGVNILTIMKGNIIVLRKISQ